MVNKTVKASNNMTLADLQALLKKREKDLRIQFKTLTKKEKDILAKTVKLSEEVGELSNDILSILSLQRKSKLSAFERSNMYDEFADVILSVFSLANAAGVDMNRALTRKIRKIFTTYIQDKP